MKIIALTLFPEMFPGPLGHSLAGRALKEGLWSLEAINIRDFAKDRHKTVDDSPYGGGTGMVMRPDILGAAIEHAQSLLPEARLIYFTPRGEPLRQARVQALKHQDLILICGRFEGIDQRVLDHYKPLEISVGDYVLSGGEVAALTFMDAAIRLIPGVIGKESALAEESFASSPSSPRKRGSQSSPEIPAQGGDDKQNCAGLLEYPHYTRPPVWNGLEVPQMLLSGHHAEIGAWRRAEAEKATRERRPDLWTEYKGKPPQGE